MMQIENISDLTPIQTFYSNQNIFITGATGFLGRILLEKLLRSCSDISTIYILIRNKKGKNLHTRIDELFEDTVFDRLKKEYPKYRHKVVGIYGDCSLPDLGMNLDDRQLLINEVNVVFHVAATVRFDEKLKLALAINVRAPYDIINLCRQIKNLKVFMHVSTAYSNVPYGVIEEKLYPSPVDCQKMMLLGETMSEKILDKLTPIILDKWPNTYTYTKMVAEDVIRQETNDLPVGVFRPAIVVSTYREPIKAWINNLYGPTGVCAGAGTGVLRTLHCDPSVNANIVPVDMCVNSLIAAGWEVGTTYEKSGKNFDIPVYNYESSNDQPISWGKFMHLSMTYGLTVPSLKAIWYYCLTLQSTIVGYVLSTILLHYIPALLVDGALICMGKSPKMLKIYKKIHKFTGVISYFCTRNWTFESNNVRKLIENMTDRDKDIFFCDLKKLDWQEFFSTYLKGIRIYLIQDPLETLSEARIRWNRLYWLHQFVKYLGIFVILRLSWWFLGAVLAIFY